MNAQSVIDLVDAAIKAEKRGQFEEALQLLRDAYAATDGPLALNVGLRLGRLCTMRGPAKHAEAEQVLARAEQLGRELHSPRQTMTAINLRALLACKQRKLDLARELLTHVETLSTDSAPGPEIGQLFHYLGIVTQATGHFANAERYYFRAVQFYDETNYEPGQSEVFDSLAALLLERGKTSGALQFAQRSLYLKRKLQDRYGEAITLGTLGRIYQVQGQYERASETYQADLDISHEIGDTNGIGIMLNSLGMVALAMGRHSAALEYLQRSSQEVPQEINQAYAIVGIARVHLAQNDAKQAGEAAGRLAAMSGAIAPYPVLRAAQLGISGAIAWREGDFAAGQERLQQAIALLTSANLSLDTIPWLYELRTVYQTQGDMVRAVEVMSQALDRLSECGSQRGIGDVETWLRTVNEPALTRLALERHFPAHLVEQILGGNLNLPQPQRLGVAVLFCDVRDYTTLTEGLAPEEIVALLNEWFGEATRAIQLRGGVIDKFIGDAVMALFGLAGDVEEAAANAVRAALDMVDALRAMNLRQKVLGGKTLRIGIGVDVGTAVVGFMGTHLRQSYTAIGDVVNTASRLEGKTKDFPGCEIVISQAVEDIQQRFHVAETTYLGSLELKGKSQVVGVYHVRGPRTGTH